LNFELLDRGLASNIRPQVMLFWNEANEVSEAPPTQASAGQVIESGTKCQIENFIHMKIIAKNKKAYFNYEILDKFEAGISLLGLEVKSIRMGHISLTGSYVVLNRNNEVFLIGATISPYQPQNTPLDYNPQRSRKLLLKKSEIKYLIGKSKERGLTIIPLSVYTMGRKIKVEIGIARGKRKFDKREKIKERDFRRRKQELLKRG